MLAAIQHEHAGSYTAFINQQSGRAQQALLAMPWSEAQQNHHAQMAAQSLARLKAIEAADVGEFEAWRLAYLQPGKLRP